MNKVGPTIRSHSPEAVSSGARPSGHSPPNVTSAKENSSVHFNAPRTPAGDSNHFQFELGHQLENKLGNIRNGPLTNPLISESKKLGPKKGPVGTNSGKHVSKSASTKHPPKGKPDISRARANSKSKPCAMGDCSNSSHGSFSSTSPRQNPSFGSVTLLRNDSKTLPHGQFQFSSQYLAVVGCESRRDDDGDSKARHGGNQGQPDSNHGRSKDEVDVSSLSNNNIPPPCDGESKGDGSGDDVDKRSIPGDVEDDEMEFDGGGQAPTSI